MFTEAFGQISRIFFVKVDFDHEVDHAFGRISRISHVMVDSDPDVDFCGAVRTWNLEHYFYELFG